MHIFTMNTDSNKNRGHSMISIISGMILPSVFHTIFYLKCRKKCAASGTDKHKRKFFYKSLKIIMISEIFLFTAMNLISLYAMNNFGEYIPSVVFALAGILPFSAAAVRYFKGEGSIYLFLRRVSILALLLMIAEVLLFNGKSFDKRKNSTLILPESITFTEGAVLENDGIVLNSSASLTIDDVPDGSTALLIGFDRVIDKDSRPIGVSLFMKDDNLSRSYEPVQNKITMAGNYETSLSFQPYGNVRSLRVDIGDVYTPVSINYIMAVSAIPFTFSLIRYFVLLGVGTLICAVTCFRLWKISYQSRKPLHIFLTEAMTILCALSVFIMTDPFEKPVKYDSKNLNINDPFSMAFDAFKKKQVHLDLDAQPELETLENVYDTSERNETGIGGFWDLAYYKGKYYCYFGCAPVLTFYMPYYLKTGMLPTVGMALGFFGMLAVWFMCRTILAVVRLMVPRANLLLLLSFMAAAPGLTGIYYLVNGINNYTLPTICGMCWIFLCLWMGLEACLTRKKPLRLVMLFVSGISLALCAASRPGIVFCSVVLVPLFIGILRNKSFKPLFRVAQAACFVIPLLIGGCLLMIYNSARFGSPFDFGFKYQLTVSNISANILSPAGIPPMIYHYFLQFPRASAIFPFFEPTYCILYNYKKYIFFADCVGVFTYPLVTAGIVFIPATIGKRSGRNRFGVTGIQRNLFIALCFTAAFLIGWLNFCLGGGVTRYVVDLMPVLILGMLLCILRGAGDPEKHGLRYVLICVSAAATFIICWLLALQVRDGSILRRFPDVYDTVEDLIIFWQ